MSSFRSGAGLSGRPTGKLEVAKARHAVARLVSPINANNHIVILIIMMMMMMIDNVPNE